MLHIHAINGPLSHTRRNGHYTNDVIILTARELLANIMTDEIDNVVCRSIHYLHIWQKT